MEALIEYAIIGVLALGVLYLLSPSLIEFFDEAVSAVGNSSELSSSEQALVTSVILLTLIVFFVFGVWIMYGAVKGKIDGL